MRSDCPRRWPHGLTITIALLLVLKNEARDIYHRLMDAVDPTLVDQMVKEASEVEGVETVEGVRVRWVGHELRGELSIIVNRDRPIAGAHAGRASRSPEP